MFFEERNDPHDEVLATLHGEAKEILAVVVSTTALDDRPAPEVLPEEFERRPGARSLGDRELVLDLPAESASRVAHYRDREAALAVNEPDDPLLDAWPFLLIARTGRIVTVHAQTLQRGCDRQYRRIHGVSSI